LKYPLIGKIGLVIQGPLVNNKDLGGFDFFNSELKKFLKKNSFLYVGVVIPYENVFLVDKLKSAGFVLRPGGLPPTAVVEDTLMLDLKKSKKELWSDVNSGRRRNIKKGLKQNFVFREGGRDELPVFHNLMLRMCDRRHTEPTHKNVEFFYLLWDNMSPQGWFKLFLLEYESDVVCALVGFSVGDTFRYWKWGWSGEYPELNFSSVLIWKTIGWAKENGFRYFDFVQVDYDVALAMKEKKELTTELNNRSFSGPTQFKVRFGGELVSTPGVYVLFRNRMIKFVFLKLVVKLLNSKRVNKLVSFIRNRSIT
jgi:lipid II:glycine glycyltransferase (peptidoglycan interpeptide bridge formation enzyme)